MADRGATIQSIGPQNIAQATLGLKGGGVPQNILVPDLLGTIELGRRSDPELLFEQDILPWTAVFNVAAGGAGTFVLVDIPVCEDIIVITDVLPVPSVASGWSLAYTATAIGVPGAVPVFSRDSRYGQNMGSGGRVPLITEGTAAAYAGANLLYMGTSLNAATPIQNRGIPWVVQGPVADASGNHLQLGASTANVQFAGTIVGYSVRTRAQ